MAARYNELLAQLAQEYERVLRENEELRTGHGEGLVATREQPEQCLRAMSSCLAREPATSEPGGESTTGSPQRVRIASRASSAELSFGFITDSMAASDASSRCATLPAKSLDDAVESTRPPSRADLEPPPPQQEMQDEDLPLFPQWRGTDEREVARTMATCRSSKSRLFEAMYSFGNSERSWGQGGCLCAHALVMCPESWIRQFWDVLAMLVVSYDVIMFPLQVFVNPDVEVLRKVHFFTTSVWTADVAMNFFTAYYSMGILQSSLPVIAMNYLKSWLIPDLAVLLIDWLIILVDTAGSAFRSFTIVRAFKAIHFLRFLRMLRLVRVLKFQGKVDDLNNLFRSDLLLTVFGVARSLVFLLVASHYVACGWYFVGGRHRPFTWVQVFEDEGRTVAYRYVTSLHWSIAQFTPASAEVQPRNAEERVFALCVILAAMVAFSCFVSSITQAMGRLQRQRAEESKHQAQLRRFFIENRVSLEVGTRVAKFISSHNIHERRRIHEADIVTFQVLPDSFRRELHLEMYGPILSAHIALTRVLHLSDSLTEDLCHEAMTELLVKPDNELLEAGEQPCSAFYLRSGVGTYARDVSTAFRRKHNRQPVMICGERWLCESTLWLRWRPKGCITAKTSMQCVSLSAEKFRDLVSKSKAAHMFSAVYAVQYRLHLLSAEDMEMRTDVGLERDATRMIVRSTLSAIQDGAGSRSSLAAVWAGFRPGFRRGRTRRWFSEARSNDSLAR